MSGIGTRGVVIFLLIATFAWLGEAQNNTACIVAGNVTWTGDFYTSLCNISLCQVLNLTVINEFAIGVLQGQVSTAQSDIINLQGNVTELNGEVVILGELILPVGTLEAGIYGFTSCGAVTSCGMNAAIQINTAEITAIETQHRLNGTTSWVPCNASICGINSQVVNNTAAILALQDAVGANGTTVWAPCNTTICGMYSQVVNNTAAIVAIEAINGTTLWQPCNVSICGLNATVFNNTAEIEQLAFQQLGAAYLDNDQTFMGANDFSEPVGFLDTTDSTGYNDSLASVYIAGGLSVKKTIYAGTDVYVNACNTSVCKLATNVTTLFADVAGNTAEIAAIEAQQRLNGSTVWIPCNASICGLSADVANNTANITTLFADVATNTANITTLFAEFANVTSSRTVMTFVFFGPWTGGINVTGCVLSRNGPMRSLYIPSNLFTASGSSPAVISADSTDFVTSDQPPATAMITTITIISGVSSTASSATVTVGGLAITIYNGLLASPGTFTNDGNQLGWTDAFNLNWTT